MNYQQKVCTAADVRALYEKVIANPAIKRYRGYTATRSYAWDPEHGEYIKREGEVWFGNPAYDEAFVPEGVATADSAELLDEQLGEKEKQLTALKVKCEQQSAQIEKLEASLAERDEELAHVTESLNTLRAALVRVMQLMPAE